MSIKGKAYIAGIYEHPTRKAEGIPTAFVACVEDAVVGAQGVASGAPRAFRFNLQVSPY